MTGGEVAEAAGIVRRRFEAVELAWSHGWVAAHRGDTPSTSGAAAPSGRDYRRSSSRERKKRGNFRAGKAWTKAGGEQEEQVSLALGLGARSNPPALAALCWDSLRRRAARDLSRAQFAVFTESLVHTIQRNERSVWFSWLSLSSFAKTIAEMERADYSSFLLQH
jgi:hypothetical protein